MRKFILTICFLMICSTGWGAVTFDGTNDCLSASIAPTSNVITITFWMYWNAFGSDDDLAMELSGNYNSTANSLIIDPNAGASDFDVAVRGTSGYRQEHFPRPSGAAWHHYAAVFDNSTDTGNTRLYIDGVEQTSTIGLNNKSGTSNIATETLYIMTRGCGSLAGAGRMTDFSIHSVELTASEVLEMYSSKVKGAALQIRPSNIFLYLPLDDCADGSSCTTASMFKDASGNGRHFSPSNGPLGRAEEVLTYR